MTHNDYHLSYFPPTLPHWPRGGWSLYHISGDEIAHRIEFGEDGRAVRRDSWPGYIAIFATLEEATAGIRADVEERFASLGFAGANRNTKHRGRLEWEALRDLIATWSAR